MRYFVYYRPDTRAVRPYILAEVIRETSDDGRYREWSAAASLAGEQCTIVTREELLQTPDGARALRAWELLDDRQFDIDTARLVDLMEAEEAASLGRHLRVVPDPPADAEEFVGTTRRLQWITARRRTLLVESIRLREEARSLIDSGVLRRSLQPPHRPTLNKEVIDG